MYKTLSFLILTIFLNQSYADDFGIKFNCKNSKKIILSMDNYLNNFNLNNYVIKNLNSNSVSYKIDLSLIKNENTTNIFNEDIFNIKNEDVYLPTKEKNVKIVSKKEIFISFLYPGRLTEIDGCSVKSLTEQIAIRQNIILWSSNLEWGWPDGGAAYWNKKYWNKGDLINKNISSSFFDMFKNQKKYGIGCYTATKIVFVHSLLDYYKRVQPNKTKFNKIKKLLLSDDSPLTSIEPRKMWYFEDDFDITDLNVEGKLLTIQHNIEKTSIIPGDWIYLLNTDKETYQKTGYEGSNAIYLGGNKFDDYYNDNNHYYTFEEKLDEVYQWRNKVFSRNRDKDKIKPLSNIDLENLKNSPENNGLLLKNRTFPKIF